MRYKIEMMPYKDPYDVSNVPNNPKYENETPNAAKNGAVCRELPRNPWDDKRTGVYEFGSKFWGG